MEHLKNYSTGGDDDLRSCGVTRASKGLACSRVLAITSEPGSSGKDEIDMEFQIHCIEMEAYGAVLRAFTAQSDSLSWDKEGLMSGLRKELRVSDAEHREILGKITSADSIKPMRDSRKIGGDQLTTTNPPFGPNSMGHLPHKKLKHGHTTVSSSLNYPAYALPSLAAIPLPATHIKDNQLVSKGSLHALRLGPDDQNMHPSTVRARGTLIVKPSKKGFVHSRIESSKPGPDIIKIRATDKLIHEAEGACGEKNPDPVLVQRAKLILRDHERTLLEAIDKLADVSDGDDPPDQTQYAYCSQEPQRSTCVLQNPIHKKRDSRSRS